MPRVLFLGADACDATLVSQWAASGQLPYFASLFHSSLRVRTTGPAAIYGGSLWPTFVTGLSPGRHGQYCYNQYSPESYTDERAAPERLTEEPFWMRIDRVGRRVGVFDVPLTPVTPLSNGFHVADWGCHDLVGPHSQCSSTGVADEVARVAGEAPMRDCEGNRHSAAEFGHLRDLLVRQTDLRTRLATHFLKQGGWDFFACVFGESHCAGHQMWHLHDPTNPDHAPEVVRALGSDPLLDVYRAIDRNLAALARRADEDTVVVVWCSHGMGAHYDATFLLDAMLERLETPAALRDSGPAVELGLARKLWRAIPFGLRGKIGRLPLALVRRAQTRRVAAARRERRFFAVADNNEQGALRINLIGREPNGRVQRGAEYDAVLAELREALLEFENVETGTRIVTGFQYPQRLHPGPFADTFPDMTVEWDRSRPIRKIRSPRTGVIEGTPITTRTGDHTPNGLLFVSHGSVPSGDVGRVVNAMDIAPTILELLGLPADGLDGVPVSEICAPAVTEERLAGRALGRSER